MNKFRTGASREEIDAQAVVVFKYDVARRVDLVAIHPKVDLVAHYDATRGTLLEVRHSVAKVTETTVSTSKYSIRDNKIAIGCSFARTHKPCPLA